jgi:hypothetical protein
MKLRIVAIITGVVLVIVGATAKNFIGFTQQERLRESFLPYVTTCLEAEITDDLRDAPAVRGKLLTIDVDRREVDHLTFPRLSEPLRATRPQEVGTLALIQYGRQHIGYYQNVETREKTGEAYRSFARVSLVDWATKTRTAEKVFLGEDPAAQLTHDGDCAGTQPMFQIVEYLEALPRR